MTLAARTFGPSVFVPFVFYMGGALGVPLLNGSMSRQDFWTHAATVGTVSVLCLLARIAGNARVLRFRTPRVRGG